MEDKNNQLGSVLANLREQKNFTLRRVEAETEISNAYLSQLEKGKIRSPSPSVLHKLSELYDVSYASLLELAGYPVPENSQPTSVTQSSFSLRMGTVTADEEEALLEYLEFMRSKRKKKRK